MDAHTHFRNLSHNTVINLARMKYLIQQENAQNSIYHVQTIRYYQEQ